MHTENLSAWTHDHRFGTGFEAAAERRTKAVVALTAVMMVTEITVGSLSNSMALLADGFHMATHVAALGIAAFAYHHARIHADDRRYTFGTGKVGALAAFTSAIILSLVAALMVWESGPRLLTPQSILFDQALLVAAVGLAVNVASALILGGGHDHHDHGHGHHHHDQNFRAAYVHVLADAVTSLLAIAALLLGKYLGWWWMDPVMGLAGAGVILNWVWGLLRQSGAVLLDINDDADLDAEVRAALIADGSDRIADLHLWRVGPGHWAAAVSLVTHTPRDPAYYKALLAPVHELSHITIEIQPCR